MTVTVDYDGKVLTIDAPARLASVIAKIPGTRAVRGEERWLADANWLTLLAIGKELSGIQGFTSSPSTSELIDRYLRHEDAIRGAKAATELPGEDRLYSYQPGGVLVLTSGGFILGDDMGTGKTVMGLTAARQVGASAYLVVAPNSMKHRWAAESDLWFPEVVPFVLDGTKANKVKTLKVAAEAQAHGEQILVTVNWEALRSLSRLIPYGSTKRTASEKEDGPLQLIDWDVVVADEVHRAKDPAAKQTRALKACAAGAEYRWGLTGTPVLNTPGDLWSLLHFAVPHEVPQSRHKWHNRYVDFMDTQWGPKDLGLRGDRSDELLRVWDMVSLRRTKDEVLDLPDITYQTRELEMAGAQGVAYRKLEKDMIAEVEGGVLFATDPLALLTRLSQAASATPILGDDDIVGLEKPSNKVTALLEILTEMDENRQLVAFAQSEKLITLAAEALDKAKVSYVRITGKETGGIRDMNVRYFQSGGARVALVTLQAGGEGIDLYAADTAVFLQRSYSFGMNTQAESRIHRNGQEAERVTVIDLVSSGTVDEEVIEALATKGEMSEQVLRDSARRRLGLLT
jgi:SNF2 family DNA or RNA helicase